MNKLTGEDTIVAISTPQGVGGIAVIRISGPDSVAILSNSWRGVNLESIASHTAHLGHIMMDDGNVLDEVVATYFKGPHSFTGEDVVEISCHGSKWIQKEIVKTLVNGGARPAEPGEFTKRAFLNGRIDLAQAEGIIDLISTASRAAHKMAIRQTDGKFSKYFNTLRDQLIELASLLELELDFAEEEVEFADRERLQQLCSTLQEELSRLADSYSAGRVIKEGIPVVIAGMPNAGKSTLLNLLLGEDKAIVTDIPGTTRDVIEDTKEIDGLLFRFADTAGLRFTDNAVEQIGIRRAEERMEKAAIILWVIDISRDVAGQLEMVEEGTRKYTDGIHILVVNKCDLPHDDAELQISRSIPTIKISAKEKESIARIEEILKEEAKGISGMQNDLIISNARHYASIQRSLESLQRVSEGLASMQSADFIAQDLREALHHLSSITGSITAPDLLASIFSRFCVGK